MKSHWLSIVRGYVRVSIRGKRVELLINELTKSGIEIWDIGRTKEGLELCVHLSDFFKLRTPLKKTGCRLHVLKRRGLPFFLARMEQRKAFMIGMFGFVAAIYILSSLIWHVEIRIEGNKQHALSEQTVREAAKEIGIYKFQWKFRLKDPEVMSKQLQAALPDASWVGIELNGTNALIKIIESLKPEEAPLYNPRHIVSASDAVITDIIAERGRPVVRVNSRVQKGDILISGIIGDEEHQEVVSAKGTVRGLVWHEYNIAVPLKGLLKSYTGESMTRYYIAIGNRALRISGFKKMNFEHFEAEASEKQLRFGSWGLPVRFVREIVREATVKEQVLSPEQASQTGIEHAMKDIESKYGLDAVVKAKNVLSVQQEDGRIVMKVMFEVERDIAEERAVLMEEIKPPDQNMQNGQ